MTPFFIGWAGLPPGLRRFMIATLAVFAAIDLGLAAALYLAQPAVGSGAWDMSGTQQITGTLITRPAPMLLVDTAAATPAHLVMLTDEWKFGVQLGTDIHDGDRVRASGYALHRADLTMLQLDRDLERVGGATPPAPALRSDGEHDLTGEIVDGKCWTGAMNPGAGKTHKGCGSLCLLGGVPALFIASEGAAGPTRWYVIADETGASLGEGLRARLGERLTLHGTVMSGGGLHEFRVAAATLLP
jgi:hypothetical protein